MSGKHIGFILCICAFLFFHVNCLYPQDYIMSGGGGIAKAAGADSEDWNMGFCGYGCVLWPVHENIRLGLMVSYNKWSFDDDEFLSHFFVEDYHIESLSASAKIIEISPVVRVISTRPDHRKIQFLGQIGAGYYILRQKGTFDYSYQDESGGQMHFENGIEFLKIEDEKIGLNFGAGLVIRDIFHCNIEIYPVHHIIFTEKKSTQYMTLNVGLNFRAH